MSKLTFKNQPTQQEVEDFIDFIEYNRSQRNKQKDFLMAQFYLGNIFLEHGTIKIRPMEQFDESNIIDKPDTTEWEYTKYVLEQVVGANMLTI